jgi:hypothetical protein
MSLAKPRPFDDVVVNVPSQEKSAPRPEDRTLRSEPVRTLLQRAFFGQENVLKVLVNSRGECYFQWGWPTAAERWDWKKVKFNDMELGEILLVLQGQKERASFFHTFDGAEGKSTTQVWVSRSGGYCTFKVKECSKSLTAAEQKVLEVLLQHAIVMMNLSL